MTIANHEFKVGTLNVKCFPVMRQKWVLHDVNYASTQADVILWQEIGIERYKAAVDALPAFTMLHRHLEVPISYNTDMFTFVDSGEVMLHPGRRLTSPDRYLTWAVLQHKASDRAFTFMNTHYVSGAWNNKRRLHKLWRKQMWIQSYEIQQRLIEKASSLTLVGGGDFNRMTLHPFNGHTKVAITNSIDHLFITRRWRLAETPLAAGPRFKGAIHTNVRFFSDHNMKIGTVVW